MLEDPVLDPDRLALDRAFSRALADRIAAGPHAGDDGDALALRALLAETTPQARPVLLAVWGRLQPTPAVCGPIAERLAADRWGLAGERFTDPEAALKAADDGRPVLIDLSGVRPWWGRLLARPDLAVTSALPDDGSPPQALKVVRLGARARPGPTGDDRSFWITDSAQTEPEIVRALGMAGFAAAPLAASGGLKLFTLAGYVQADDPRLNLCPGLLTGVIGAAPVFSLS